MYIKIGKFIAKHKILFYILTYTWGILQTIIGLFVAGFLLIFKKAEIKKDIDNTEIIYLKLKQRKSYSFSIGTTIVCGFKDRDVIRHELGHSIQNAIFGPFAIFIVSIPSAIRYWYRELKIRKKKELKTGYYDIWFESSANELGRNW